MMETQDLTKINSLYETKEVMTAINLLEKGWVLLRVCGDKEPVYVLGNTLSLKDALSR